MPKYMTTKHASNIEAIISAVCTTHSLSIVHKYDKSRDKATHLLSKEVRGKKLYYVVKAIKRNIHSLESLSYRNMRYMFSKEGTLALVNEAEKTGAVAILIVMFNNGDIYSLDLAKALPLASEGMGGRDDRGDPKDMELQFFFPDTCFKFQGNLPPKSKDEAA